ncbi:MAG TPA: DUF2490 domain-containing protein [Pyrinomonadaceae bacterium]|nr:DUF2490 domain-containing protein [Pyrinomonadaceae bacterium]
MKKYFFIIILTVFCTVSASSQTVDDNSDIVGWGDAIFIIPLKKEEEAGKKVDQWTLNVGGVLRFGRNLNRPIDQRGLVTLNYRINKYFTVGSGYLYRRFRPTEARRQFEHRLMFFLNSSKNWTNVQLRNRSLTTYLIKHSRPNTVVFRNRAQLNFPIMKDKKEIITPFVADEPFYDFREKKWFRNDFFAGVSKQFTPKFGADFYYLHQNFSLGSLRQTNGFGVSLRVKLDFIK